MHLDKSVQSTLLIIAIFDFVGRPASLIRVVNMTLQSLEVSIKYLTKTECKTLTFSQSFPFFRWYSV